MLISAKKRRERKKKLKIKNMTMNNHLWNQSLNSASLISQKRKGIVIWVDIVYIFFLSVLLFFEIFLTQYRVAGNQQAQSYLNNCLLFTAAIVHNQMKSHLERVYLHSWLLQHFSFGLELYISERRHQRQSYDVFNHSRITKMIREKIYVY